MNKLLEVGMILLLASSVISAFYFWNVRAMEVKREIALVIACMADKKSTNLECVKAVKRGEG